MNHIMRIGNEEKNDGRLLPRYYLFLHGYLISYSQSCFLGRRPAGWPAQPNPVGIPSLQRDISTTYCA